MDSVKTDEVLKQNSETGDFKLVMDDGSIESLGEFISPEELFEDLINRVRRYHPSDDRARNGSPSRPQASLLLPYQGSHRNLSLYISL